MAADIADISAVLHWHGGHRITADLIRYLPDRAAFEPRWHPAMARLHEVAHRGRCGFVWGDSDAVAPMAILETLDVALTRRACERVVLRGRGHFVQLEAPDEWVRGVVQIATRG